MQYTLKSFTTIIVLLFCMCLMQSNAASPTDSLSAMKQINAMLDSFNIAAANADYNAYFNFYTDDAIFTGTDATERWNKKAFMIWAKPYFDKGHTWNFTSLERHIYFDTTGMLAWFDELLNTQMKICRGSGVVVKEGNNWKIKQYILSATIPNDEMDNIIKLKTKQEDSIINKLSPGAVQQKENTQQNIDALTASPKNFKLLLENEHIRVLEYTLKPGEKDTWHTHPPKSSYVVSGGKLKVFLENGETILADEKAGTASWMDYAGKHYVENIGSTTVTIILTEIK